jgi:transcriptional regulator with XRE-family HTH domain
MSDKPKIRLDTGKRLAQIRGSANQADFAVSIGVHKNTYGGYERGEVEVGAEALRQLASRGWSPLWVLTGYGEPRLPDDVTIATDPSPASVHHADAPYRRDERHTSYTDDMRVRDRAARTAWDDPVRPVRQDVLKAALELSAEALGEKALPAAKQAELITLVYELLEEGLPKAKVLRFARAASA